MRYVCHERLTAADDCSSGQYYQCNSQYQVFIKLTMAIQHISRPCERKCETVKAVTWLHRRWQTKCVSWAFHAGKRSHFFDMWIGTSSRIKPTYCVYHQCCHFLIQDILVQNYTWWRMSVRISFSETTVFFVSSCPNQGVVKLGRTLIVRICMFLFILFCLLCMNNLIISSC